MEILKFPHPLLLKPCKTVTVFDVELKVLLDAMWDTMVVNNGMGLAANQVGLPWNMFVMDANKGHKVYLVNPKIIAEGLEFASVREGCLSAPGEFVVVPDRRYWVHVKFQDETGKECLRAFHDIQSVCAQHEIEHLHGKSHFQSKSLPKRKRIELAKKWGLK